MLEVLGEAGKIQYKKRFHRKSSGIIRCMFCKEEFDGVKVCRQHIIDDHWDIFQDTVSICYTCYKFLYENVISTVYAFAGVCELFTYESIYLCGICDIVHFSIF